MNYTEEDTNLDKISFKIIATAGEAKSCFIKAIECASQNNFIEAHVCIDKGLELQKNSYLLHKMLMSKKTVNKIMANMLLIHAEDILSSTETIKVMAENAIIQYQRINSLETKLAR